MEDVDLERYVLGTAIFDKSARPRIFLKTKEEYFYINRWKKVFRVCKSLYENKKDIDVPVVIAEVTKICDSILQYEVEELELFKSECVDYFIEEMERNYRLRYYRSDVYYGLANKLQEKNVTPEDVEGFLSDALAHGMKLGAPAKIAQIDLAEVMTRLENEKPDYIPTYFEGLDNHIGGLSSGNLIVIGGRTGSGKTALALNIAYNILRKDIGVGFISLEMTTEELSHRLLAISADVDLLNITSKRLYESDRMRINNCYDKLDEMLKRFYPVHGDININSICLLIRKMVKEHNCRAAIIDYVQLIENPEISGGNPYLELKSITRKLKLLALELGIPVVILSQLNRQASARTKPALQDLRDSGSIEQDADIVMFTHFKDEENKEDAQVIIAKGRNVKTGEVDMRFIPEYTRYL